MASGWTTTGSLADSLDTIRSSARSTREYEGVMSQLATKETLDENSGLSWTEILYAAMTAQRVTENTELDNPQQFSDTIITITPVLAGIETFITDRTKKRITKKGISKLGAIPQQAIQRLKDEDGLSLFASGATTSEPGAGNTMVSSYIASARYNISSNTTEKGNPPYRCVLHGFSIKDLYDELVAGIGTYILTEGATARVFSTGFMLPVAGCEVYEDGNITIDSSGDATGGVFCQEALIIVQGMAPRIVPVRNEKRGGGGEHVYHYDEYAWGQRNAGVWDYRMTSDATAPTS